MTLIIILSIIYLLGIPVTYKYFQPNIGFAVIWPIELVILIVLLIGGIIWSLFVVTWENFKEWYYNKSTRQ